MYTQPFLSKGLLHKSRYVGLLLGICNYWQSNIAAVQPIEFGRVVEAKFREFGILENLMGNFVNSLYKYVHLDFFVE